MRAKIEIKMDNAAFDDGMEGRAELARILKDLASKYEDGYTPCRSVMDSNGNVVGTQQITGRPTP